MTSCFVDRMRSNVKLLPSSMTFPTLRALLTTSPIKAPQMVVCASLRVDLTAMPSKLKTIKPTQPLWCEMRSIISSISSDCRWKMEAYKWNSLKRWSSYHLLVNFKWTLFETMKMWTAMFKLQSNHHKSLLPSQTKLFIVARKFSLFFEKVYARIEVAFAFNASPISLEASRKQENFSSRAWLHNSLIAIYFWFYWLYTFYRRSQHEVGAGAGAHARSALVVKQKKSCNSNYPQKT